MFISTIVLVLLVSTGGVGLVAPLSEQSVLDTGLGPKASSRILTMEFSTYYGGSGDDWITGNCFDDEGNQMIAGITFSDDLPVFNAQQQVFGGVADGFVAKYSSENELVFASYFGGNGSDEGRAIIADDQGNIIIAGYTESHDLSVLNALQGELQGHGDGFVAKFTPSGELLFATFIGGSGDIDIIERITIDPYGNYLFVGSTDSEDLQTTPGAFQESYGGGTRDTFIMALSEDGQSIEYCSYLGDENEQTMLGVAVDSTGSLGLVGLSFSGWNTTSQAFQQEYGGGQSDAIVAKVGANCSSLEWTTLIGGNGWEFGDNIEFDSNDNIVVAGYSGSSDFPLVNQIFNDEGSYDAFITKIESDGTGLLTSTHLGGVGEDRSYGMCLLSDDTVVVTSPAGSNGLPTPNGFQEENAGSFDAYIALLGPDDWSVESASYVGGAYGDYCMGLSVLDDSQILLTGYSRSNDFPVLNPVQENRSGSDDGFVVLLSITTVSDDASLLLPLGIAILALTLVVILVIMYRRR